LFAAPPTAKAGEIFPHGAALFAPLRADPRELQYAVRLVEPVSHTMMGEAAIGDYFSLYRAEAGAARIQASVGGGVFGRFDLSSATNDMQSVDFYANVPLDWRFGRWSGRFMLYHSSSHLGDDFLKTSGRVTSKHAWDNLRWLLSFEPRSRLRTYAGLTYAFRTLPEDIGRTAVQGGFEWRTAPLARQHLEIYWANDFQAWERNEWNPMFNSQAGLRFFRTPEDSKTFDVFLEFGAGRRPQGQFFLEKETRWSLGLRCHV
jgi:hypothetical protein